MDPIWLWSFGPSSRESAGNDGSLAAGVPEATKPTMSDPSANTCRLRRVDLPQLRDSAMIFDVTWQGEDLQATLQSSHAESAALIPSVRPQGLHRIDGRSPLRRNQYCDSGAYRQHARGSKEGGWIVCTNSVEEAGDELARQERSGKTDG